MAAKQSRIPAIVIGGGMSGASCAYELSKHGIQSLVLEARDRIGGRTYTYKAKNGYCIDLGASNVHGFQREDNPTKILAREIGIQCQIANPPEPPMYFAPDGTVIANQQVAQLKEEISGIIQTHIRKHQNKNTNKEDVGLGESVLPALRALHPYADPLARFVEINSLTLEQFSSRWHQTEKGFAGTDALPVGGYQNMAERAIQLSKAEVELETQVVAISDQGDSINVQTADGREYSCSHCVVTVPLPILRDGDITFNPPLPESRISALSNATYGTLNKACLIYPHSWWKPDPASFIFLRNTDKHKLLTADSTLDEILSCSFLMAQNFMSCHLEAVPVLLVYCAGHTAELLEKFSDEQIGKAMHDFLAAKICASPQQTIAPPLSCKYIRWKEDIFAKGAHTSPMGFGKGTPDDLRELGKPLWDGRLRFAGEHTDYDLRGSIPGAIATGIREATAVVGRLS